MSDALPILPGLDTPPTDAELNLLDVFLGNLRPGGGPELSTVDGFITAVAIAPEDIEQDEWLRSIVGDFAAAFLDLNEAVTIINIMERRRCEILHTLRTAPPSFLPMIDVLDEEEGDASGWCEGFMNAVGHFSYMWEPVIRHPEGIALFTPVVALAEPESLAEIEPRKAKRWRQAMLFTSMLPDIIPAIERLSRVLREHGDLDKAPTLEALAPGLFDDAPEPPQLAPKVGRNDPCPCGSGKKFKRCCGAAG